MTVVTASASQRILNVMVFGTVAMELMRNPVTITLVLTVRMYIVFILKGQERFR